MRRDSRVPQISAACAEARILRSQRPSRRARVGRWLVGAILGLAATTLGAAPAHAQVWGVKGGLNLSTVKLEDIDTAAEASAVVGGFVRVPLAGRLRLQVEGLFAQRRITFEEIVDHELNYVEIPVLARYRVLTVGGRPIHVLGGAVIGLRLSANEIISGESEDVKEAYEPVDLGASIGGEVAISRRWFADVRYVFGLTNANKVSDVPGVPALDVKFRTFQVTVGFGF